MRPILEITGDGGEHALSEIREQLSSRLQLSELDLAERLASGTQTVFWNRVAWAVQYLKAAGAIEPVRRAVYRITERGRSLAKGAQVNVKALRQYPEFAEFAGKGAEDPGDEDAEAAPTVLVLTEAADTPEE